MIGRYRQLDINPPFSMLVGDWIEREGNIVHQMRGGVSVAQRTITAGPDAGPWPLTEARTISSVFLWEGPKVPGIEAVCTKVNVLASGQINVTFADGSGRLFTDFAAMKLETENVVTDSEIPQNLIIQKIVARSPDGANLTNQVGSMCAINPSADAYVVYAEAEQV